MSLAKIFFAFLVIVAGFSTEVLATPVVSELKYKDCAVSLHNGLLTLENSRIKRVYNWKDGDISTKLIVDKTGNYSWNFGPNQSSDFSLFARDSSISSGRVEFGVEPAGKGISEHLRVEVFTTKGNLQIKRLFRIYSNTPAISCEFYYRGRTAPGLGTAAMSKASTLKNIENAALLKGDDGSISMERWAFPHRHWRIRTVALQDITDRFNTLVQETSALTYINASGYKGNLLFAEDVPGDNGFFLVKESPLPESQLYYPGADFLVSFTDVKITGLGISARDLDPEKWTRGYGFAFGVYKKGEFNRLSALRSYQRNKFFFPGKRGELIMSNTWGDRSMDEKLSEEFMLKEIDAAARLGVTNVQLDAGWEDGKGGPHKKKFPNGFEPLMKRAKEKGIEISLWFEPHKNDYRGWADDVSRMLVSNKHYGVSMFKVDGVQIETKEAEMNFRKLLDSAREQKGDRDIFYNLDVTAGRRNGYFYFDEYGNWFLENRYTDWSNYYPHFTLRNLWMLSKYIPPQKLQVEFLNNFRNRDKYPSDDKLAPRNASMEYEFAITMMGQPLAWMEMSELPEEAFAIAPVLKKYRELQADIHEGNIFPVGEEPSGIGWTGFQSVKSDGRSGYMLVFRELNHLPYAKLKTWFRPGQKVRFESVIGKGKSFNGSVNEKGEVLFTLPSTNSYSLYTYKVVN